MNTPAYIHSAQSRTARSLPQRMAPGFTLVELLVTIAVAALLLAAAVPTLSGVAKSIRLSAASNAFVSGLYLARSRGDQAQWPGGAVQVRGRRGLRRSTGGWEQGWIVFHDANNNGRADGREPVIRREAAPGREPAPERQPERVALCVVHADRRDQADRRRLPGRHAHGVPVFGGSRRGAGDRPECGRPPAGAQRSTVGHAAVDSAYRRTSSTSVLNSSMSSKLR